MLYLKQFEVEFLQLKDTSNLFNTPTMTPFCDLWLCDLRSRPGQWYLSEKPRPNQFLCDSVVRI